MPLQVLPHYASNIVFYKLNFTSVVSDGGGSVLSGKSGAVRLSQNLFLRTKENK